MLYATLLPLRPISIPKMKQLRWFCERYKVDTNPSTDRQTIFSNSIQMSNGSRKILILFTFTWIKVKRCTARVRIGAIYFGEFFDQYDEFLGLMLAWRYHILQMIICSRPKVYPTRRPTHSMKSNCGSWDSTDLPIVVEKLKNSFFNRKTQNTLSLSFMFPRHN